MLQYSTRGFYLLLLSWTSGESIVHLLFVALFDQAGTVRVSRGVVFASFYDPKFLVNNIVADNFDPVSKEPEYKVTAVSVKKVTEVENL